MPPKVLTPAAKQAIHTKRKRKAIDALEAMYGAPPPLAEPAVVPAPRSQNQRSQRASQDGAAPGSSPTQGGAEGPPPPASPWASSDRSAEEGTGIYQRLDPDAPTAATGGFDVEEFIFSLVKQSAKGAVGPKLRSKSLRLDDQPRKFGHPRPGPKNPKMMSTETRKQDKALFELPQERADFASSAPLHALWEQYMDECWPTLGDAPSSNGGGRPVPAAVPSADDPIDLTGSLPTVVAARCRDQVGLKGLAVRETSQTLQLLTTENKLKRVPKKGTTICVVHRRKKITLTLQPAPPPASTPKAKAAA